MGTRFLVALLALLLPSAAAAQSVCGSTAITAAQMPSGGLVGGVGGITEHPCWPTPLTVGDGLSLSTDTLSALWNAGSVTSLGSGLSLIGGTLSSAVSPGGSSGYLQTNNGSGGFGGLGIGAGLVSGGGSLAVNIGTSGATIPLLNTPNTWSAEQTLPLVAIGGGTIDNTAIGSTTPAAGAFTLLSAIGQITSTLSNGTAPFVVASSTNVPNLNASSLNGATFASPGPIGSTTPGAVTATTLTLTTSQSAAQFLASPAGSSGAPSFRSLASSDVTGALGFTPQTNALAAADLLVGNGSGVAAAVSPSGDVAMTNAGVFSIGNLSHVTNGSLANSGLVNSGLTLGSTGLTLGGTVTSVAGLTLTSPTVSGGTIDNAVIGGGTPAAATVTTLTASGAASFTAAGTGLAVTNNATVGQLQVIGAANNAEIQGAATGFSPFIFAYGGDTNINLTLGCKGSCKVLSNETFQAPYFASQGVTQTLSGATVPTFLANINGNYTGSSTITGDTSINLMQLGSPSDNVSVPNGSIQDLYIVHTVGAAFDGNRNGIEIQEQDSANSSGTPNAPGALGIAALAISSFNSGGVALNYGFGGNNGLGSYFGGNLGYRLNGGATYKLGATALELDANVAAGASLVTKVGEQINNVASSAVRGLIEDYAFRIADQTSASAGWSVMEAVGSYGARWPGDGSTYIFQAQSSENTDSWPANAAAGFDLNQAIISGSACGTVRGNGSVECPEGGGFYWRNPGVQLLAIAAQVGYGSLADDSNGIALDAGYQQMAEAAGSIGVATGGASYTSGDVSCDIYGDCVTVTASGGVVSAIASVLTRGWQTSPPSNPVTFVSRTRIGSAFGTGLTLNLSWTSKTGLDLGTANAVAIGIGNSGSTITLAGTVTMPTSTTGAGTQTFVNSPCSGLTTEKWIPVHITGQTGTWNIPACQ